jgi:hypothetical protein
LVGLLKRRFPVGGFGNDDVDWDALGGAVVDPWLDPFHSVYPFS